MVLQTRTNLYRDGCNKWTKIVRDMSNFVQSTKIARRYITPTNITDATTSTTTTTMTTTATTTTNNNSLASRRDQDCWSSMGVHRTQKNFSTFASTTLRNEEVWKNIVKELEDVGFTRYTWKQAENKWKNLRKGYMKVKDNSGDKSSGAARVTCTFYDELDEIFRKSPSVKPISVASSRNSKSLPATDTIYTDSDSDKDLLEHQSTKKKTKLQKDTLALLSIFRDDANVKEAARENRHQQTLNTLNRAIDSYEVKMQKLINKF